MPEAAFAASLLAMSTTASFCNHILNQSQRVWELQTALTALPALGPENGGQGELAKALYIEKCLKEIGVTVIRRLDSPDSRVESGLRPNIITRMPGLSRHTLWLFGHLDVVPPGDPAAWQSDPWQAREQDGMIYGRGVEDNQQAVCSMLVLMQCLRNLGIQPLLGLGLVFMADEELGSKHGLEYILKTAPELFQQDDLYIVPDGGSADASLIEIAEKGQLWLKFTILGSQCHASTPDDGVNSFIAASRLTLALGGLNQAFANIDPLFMPPRSTFVPTKHDANVDAINILPGKDVFYMDCRLLPDLSEQAVMSKCAEITSSIAAQTGTVIETEIVHRSGATFSDAGSHVVSALKAAITAVYEVEAKVCGIGGATVAALLRKAGLSAAVWSCIKNTCHQPNECSSIAATLKDAAVFAHILMRGVSA